ncbi:ASICN [Lepeophtheirus salmonis]|uniref:ASICN n=1 Tax=Lepeophtheirus salmonis TaxID=72036 RepID=A0A7R8CNB7_LEPSM|nr:ASICN [Lepeophtheirus salmonis]CAF2871697.1 ASICN [Lepeophtheirus salmonis]
MEDIRRIFGDEDLVKKGVLADTMFMMTPYRSEAYELAKKHDWAKLMNVTYVTDSGWYFKTQAVQEIGENVVLRATYQRTEKNIEKFTRVPFNDLIQNYSRIITPGIRLGKENGLSFLVDAEVYDYGFSPQRGEGFKLAIHHHMDQPIMALSDVDISPGFVTQLSVTPTLTVTTEEAKRRFTPDERVCYFDEEFKFKYLPDQMYRYGLSNCLFAATYDTILSRCKCVPFFHTIAYADYPRICSGKSLYCMNTILSDIGSHTHDQRNKLAVTTSVFPNQNTFASSSSNGEFCAVLKKIRSTCQTDKKVTLSERYPGICKLVTKYGAALCHNEMDEYYHGTLGEYGYREKKFIDEEQDSNSNIGGILGLTMGCSLVTIFEILHHIILIFLKTGAKSISTVRKTIRRGGKNESDTPPDELEINPSSIQNGSALVSIETQTFHIIEKNNTRGETRNVFTKGTKDSLSVN